MKINRYFPPYPNCLSPLLILECSYESYQPLRPHLPFQFFFIQWQPLSSPHPCQTLDFASLWLHQGFWARPCSALLALSVWSPSGWPPLPEVLLLVLPDGFLQPSSCGLPSWALTPFSWKTPLLPHVQCSLNWGPLTSGFFQLEPFNLTDAVQSRSCACWVFSYYRPFSSGILFWGHLWLLLLALPQPTLMWLSITFMRCCLRWTSGPNTVMVHL